jgi:hypothetical protein
MLTVSNIDKFQNECRSKNFMNDQRKCSFGSDFTLSSERLVLQNQARLPEINEIIRDSLTPAEIQINLDTLKTKLKKEIAIMSSTISIEKMKEIKFKNLIITNIHFSINNIILFSTSNNQIVIYDNQKDEIVEYFSMPNLNSETFKILSDPDLMAVGAKNGEIYIYNFQKKSISETWLAFNGKIWIEFNNFKMR